MENLPISNTNGPRKESVAALKVIDSLLLDSDHRTITAEQAFIILDALAGAGDPSLVARFPAVLAICAHKGIELSSQDLFSRYWESSPKRQNLEKLLLISSWLFQRENIQAPKNLDKITGSFKRKYSDLFSGEICQLSSGLQVSTKDMHNALKRYTTYRPGATAMPAEGLRFDSTRLQTHLGRLFSPKQTDLVFKKLNQQLFTKTEREYYSRVVRKKLEAIANEEISEIALTLTRKKSANREGS